MISACMIVKNEAEMLKKTLPTISKGVKQLIVVDTGSTDNSIDVAREFGAEVIEFEWINDFAAARNVSLQNAKEDWIIWVDADEYVSEEGFSVLKDVLSTVKKDFAALSLEIMECREESTACDDFSYRRAKIFRNNVGIKFDRPINEQIVMPDGSPVKSMLYDDVKVYHWGNIGISDEKYEQKRARNITMLEEALKGNEDDFLYNYLLAKNLCGVNGHSRALEIANNIQKNIEVPQAQFEEFNVLRLQIMKKIGDFNVYFEELKSMYEKYHDFFYVQWNYAFEVLKKGMVDDAIKIATGIIEGNSEEEIRTVSDREHARFWPYYILGIVSDLRKDASSAKEYYANALKYKEDSKVRARLTSLSS